MPLDSTLLGFPGSSQGEIILHPSISDFLQNIFTSSLLPISVSEYLQHTVLKRNCLLAEGHKAEMNVRSSKHIKDPSL